MSTLPSTHTHTHMQTHTYTHTKTYSLKYTYACTHKQYLPNCHYHLLQDLIQLTQNCNPNTILEWTLVALLQTANTGVLVSDLANSVWLESEDTWYHSLTLYICISIVVSIWNIEKMRERTLLIRLVLK